MMWALIKRSATNRNKSWLTYCGIGAGFLLLYMAFFPSVQQQAADYNKIFESLPKGIAQAFNITQNSTTLMGFLSSKHYGFVWPLMIILMLTAYAGGSLAREVEQRTMGLLLSLPVSRMQLYWTRVVGGVYGLVLFIVFSELITWPLAQVYGYECSWGDVARVGELGFLFGLSILGLGLMLSAAFDEAGKVYSAISGVLLAMYVANIVSALEPSVDKLKYVSLFHYFDPGTVVASGHLEGAAMLVFIGVSASAAIAGAYIFQRRDVSV